MSPEDKDQDQLDLARITSFINNSRERGERAEEKFLEDWLKELENQSK